VDFQPWEHPGIALPLRAGTLAHDSMKGAPWRAPLLYGGPILSGALPTPLRWTTGSDCRFAGQGGRSAKVLGGRGADLQIGGDRTYLGLSRQSHPAPSVDRPSPIRGTA
jgi:hypothetical protein